MRQLSFRWFPAVSAKWYQFTKHFPRDSCFVFKNPGHIICVQDTIRVKISQHIRGLNHGFPLISLCCFHVFFFIVFHGLSMVFHGFSMVFLHLFKPVVERLVLVAQLDVLRLLLHGLGPTLGQLLVRGRQRLATAGTSILEIFPETCGKIEKKKRENSTIWMM